MEHSGKFARLGLNKFESYPLMRASFALFFTLALTACSTSPKVPTSETQKNPFPSDQVVAPSGLRAETAVRNFIAVVDAVEPVAERVCRERAPAQDCDFQIVVNRDFRAAPNAFQTVDDEGRPIIAFTTSLIGVARNQDELAFILAHEAAHHISGHLGRTRQNASLGAAVAGILFGGDSRVTQTAQQIGAAIGARRYSKDFELEADALGTVIAARAGFDPIVGSEFFTRIPDPGNQFLGTHPANADRVATVQRVAAGL